MAVQVVLNKKQISTHLNVDVLEAVKRSAKKHDKPICDVVEEAIVEQLDLDTTEIQWTKTVK